MTDEKRTFAEHGDFQIDLYAKALEKALTENDIEALKKLAATMVEKSKISYRDRALSWWLTPEESEKYLVWREEIRKKGAELQMARVLASGDEKAIARMKWRQGFERGPSTGAIGGAISISFTSTSLGRLAEVHDSVTDEKLLLTDVWEM